MEMKEYIIDCRRMGDITAAHDYLSEVFSFPQYYGRNLDALYDCLSEIPPCRVKLEYPWALSELGDYGIAILRVFRDVAGERSCFELE